MKAWRPLLLCGVAFAGLSTVPADAQSSLDVPMRGAVRVAALDSARPCDLWRTVEELGRLAGVRVGFENTRACVPGGRERRAYGPSLTLDGLTPRTAFDQIVQARPDFAWREIDGVVVMRPVAAWSDATHVLHRAVAPLALTSIHPHLALHEVLQAAQPSLFFAHQHAQLSSLGRRIDDPSATGLIDVPISVQFAGGTLLQALNAVAKPFGGSWELAYAGRPHVELYTPDFDEGSTGLTMRPPTERY